MQSIKLNALADNAMNKIKGGDQTTPPEPPPVIRCTCSCYWQGQGGSSNFDNGTANHAIGENGGHSIHGENGTGYSAPRP